MPECVYLKETLLPKPTYYCTPPLIKRILLNFIYEMSLGICNINIILPGFVNATNLGYRALMPSNKIYWLKYLPRIFLIRISDLSWTCAHSVLRISGMGKSRLLTFSTQLKFSTQAGPCLIPRRPKADCILTYKEQAHFKTFWKGHGIISI